ncbi:MAG: phage baseplate assembly protein V [Rhodobacteraceae bacterium]|nr:phage baseplate assembly protein V [Paracoccaceae bacterium]
MSIADDDMRAFGKYRGQVVNNIDPQGQGRVQVSVPAIYGTNTLNWAMPCVPYAGPGVGLHLIPPVGANVWVEFEGGDIDYPIWAGAFWGQGECPSRLPTEKLLVTSVATLTFDDANPAAPVVIETPSGRIVITQSGITLEASTGASVELSGPKVSINNGALEVI